MAMVNQYTELIVALIRPPVKKGLLQALVAWGRCKSCFLARSGPLVNHYDNCESVKFGLKDTKKETRSDNPQAHAGPYIMAIVGLTVRTKYKNLELLGTTE